jgi:DNA-binding GntR family transcriptional regulator
MPARNSATAASGSEIRPKSLRAQVVEVLERAIITGIYKPGQRLVERDLVERFGVSSIPIREALQELENRGLVSKRHNYGCTVIQLTPGEVEDICKLRDLLEPKVMEWATARITSEGAKRLRELLARMTRAAEKDDLAEFYHSDLLFHKTIWEISGNRWAARALETALGSLFVAGMIGGRESGKLDLVREAKKHERLLKLLESGDGEAAANVLADIASGFEKHLQIG